MTAFSEKYTSNITSSTMNRGVEAKEAEIANTQLDAEGGAGAGGGDESRSCSDAAAATPCDCPSYLQVVVEKHRQRGGVAPPPAPPPRLPRASSPSPASAPQLSTVCCMRCVGGCGAGDGAAGVGVDKTWCGGGGGGGEADCVEVYRFLRVGRALACSGGGGGGGAGGVRRRARRWARGARALAAEAGAAARLALGAPLAGLVLALRWVLQLTRDAAQGALHAASDYTLKPALALLFNALLHPLLVFLHNLLQGSREAARPLCAALGECAAHAATVLAAVRVVEVRGSPPCLCTAPAPAHLLHNT